MTLKEFTAKYGFGVWYSTKLSPKRKIFKSLGISEKQSHRIIGEDSLGYEASHLLEDVQFVLYEEETVKDEEISNQLELL